MRYQSQAFGRAISGGYVGVGQRYLYAPGYCALAALLTDEHWLDVNDVNCMGDLCCRRASVRPG